ncbi:MAG: RNA polymerase sigma factor, partial [Merismopedia sp. SIO2A8]|nr:RNA polymerase sigma factor [Merismopedia sp. SIO2A8]
VQKYVGKIHNLQAWLVQLTRNLCIDIIRQRSLEATGVDSLEWVGVTENIDTAPAHDSPQQALEKEEKATAIQQAIASLPESLRNTFRLHFYQQRTHIEITDELGITYDNVCKRISRARKELKEKLSGYFHGTDGKEEGRKDANANVNTKEQSEVHPPLVQGSATVCCREEILAVDVESAITHGTEGEEVLPEQVEDSIAPIVCSVEDDVRKEVIAVEQTPEKTKVHPPLAQGAATVCCGEKPTKKEEKAIAPIEVMEEKRKKVIAVTQTHDLSSVATPSALGINAQEKFVGRGDHFGRMPTSFVEKLGSWLRRIASIPICIVKYQHIRFTKATLIHC